MDLGKLTQQLKIHEGVRTHPYVDTVGKISIGCGRNLDDVGLRDDEIEYLLKNDIQNAIVQLDHALPWAAQLDDVRYRALLDLCFNMGINRLMQFKQTLAAIKRGDYDQAASQLLQSKYATQVRGRAITISKMLRTGQDVLDFQDG